MKNPLFAILAIFGVLSHAASATEQADVIVVTANPAAVTAAQGAAKVIVLEESADAGAIVAGGLTNTDIRKHGAVGRLYLEFT